MPNYEKDREAARQWARMVLADPHTVILDTETTGLDDRAEICQIAAINLAGDALFNSLVRPTTPIPPEASRIHGITNAIVEIQMAPTWLEVERTLAPILLGSRLIIYNADYDIRLIEQSYWAAGVTNAWQAPLMVAPHETECAMHWYSKYVGEWNDYHGNYRWQRLPGGDHSALGDCLATLDVLKRMAAE
jgi:DNA polymerase III subunit epsilon